MQEKNRRALGFITSLLELEMVQDLELFDDQGVKVSTHTYDVLKISIDELKKDLQENVEGMEIHVMHEDIFNSMHRI